MDTNDFAPLVLDVTDPLATLHLTQAIRLKAINEITKGGKEIPSDPKDLMTWLKDMDNTALTTRRIDVDEAAGGRTTQALLDAMESLDRNSNKGRVIDGTAVRVDRPDPAARLSLPDPGLVEGEDVDFEQKLNVADFLSDDE